MMTFQAIRFDHVEWWWLLLIPWVLASAWLGWWRFRRRVLDSIAGKTLVPRMQLRAFQGRRVAVGVLVLLSLELLALAAMRPRYGLREMTLAGRGVDVAIVLDVSRSMKVADVAPDRLTASIMEISRFLDMAQGNRFALVPFAGIPFIQSPLTLDTEVIRQYLEDLRISDVPVPGTAIGRALQAAQMALGLQDDEALGSTHKAIVLFTDGENHEGEPLEMAKTLAQRNVRLLTVGVGTPAGQPVPLLNDEGQVIGTAREEDGVTPVLSKLNEELLGGLASLTKGRQFALTPGADVAVGLKAELDSLQKVEYQLSVQRLMEDRFQIPLAMAVGLLLLAFMLLGWNRGQKILVAALFVAMIGAASPSWAQSWLMTNHRHVDKALKQAENGEYGDAAAALEEIALQELSGRGDLWYNLALVRNGARDYEGAGRAIDGALGLVGQQSHLDWPSKAQMLHAKGTILMEQARHDDSQDRRQVRAIYRSAAQAFIEALQLDLSLDAARHNLELAAMNAWPPCSQLDDSFEPNNSRQEAKYLTPDPQSGQISETLLLCPMDEDHFRLPIRGGETLIAAVLQPGEENKPAAVSMELSDGEERILSHGDKGGRWRPEGDGEAWFAIRGAKDEDGVDYVLQVQLIPPCPAGDDAFEDNDTKETARPIEDGRHSARICPHDDDWFVYTEPQDAEKKVLLLYEGDQGVLDLEVFLADGALVDTVRHQEKEMVQVAAALPKAQQDAVFHIHVFGRGSEGFYQLVIEDLDGQDDSQCDSPQEQQEQQDQQEQDQQQQDSKQNQQHQGAMQEMLESIDKNEENLEAQEALRQSAYRDWLPQKDW